MNYDELCKSLGIDREAIRNACDVPVTGAIGREPGNPKKIGLRFHRPLNEDLSHLNGENGRKIYKFHKPTTTKPK